MTYKYIFDPIALAEYKDAISWYGERSATALDNFIISINEKISDICSDPATYKSIYKEYRETSLKKFPYSIVYLVNEERKTVIITSIYHHKRQPKRKYIK